MLISSLYTEICNNTRHLKLEASEEKFRTYIVKWLWHLKVEVDTREAGGHVDLGLRKQV